VTLGLPDTAFNEKVCPPSEKKLLADRLEPALLSAPTPARQRPRVGHCQPQPNNFALGPRGPEPSQERTLFALALSEDLLAFFQQPA